MINHKPTCPSHVDTLLPRLLATPRFAVVAGTPLHVECTATGHRMPGSAVYTHDPPDHPRITINTSAGLTESSVSALLTHELVHAADALRGVDLRTCGGLACSEVRAAAVSECAGGRGKRGGVGALDGLVDAWAAGLHAACVRNTASASVALVFPRQGDACVAAVLEGCLASVARVEEDGTRDWGALCAGGGGLA